MEHTPLTVAVHVIFITSIICVITCNRLEHRLQMKRKRQFLYSNARKRVSTRILLLRCIWQSQGMVMMMCSIYYLSHSIPTYLPTY